MTGSWKSRFALGMTIAALSSCGNPSDIARELTEVEAIAEELPCVDTLGGGVITPVHNGQAGSPHVRVNWKVKGTDISITYGRPFLKGRIVGDTVEPLEDSVWRLGADEATTFSTSGDLMVGATHVPAGTYTLWTLTSADTTRLIINAETGQWGTAYDQARDVGRATMTVGILDTPANQLTLSIENSELRFEWGAMVASVPVMVH